MTNPPTILRGLVILYIATHLNPTSNLKYQPGLTPTIPPTALDAHHLSGSHGSCTTKKQTSTPIMPKAPKENTRARNTLKKKNDSAVDELQQQVAREKKK